LYETGGIILNWLDGVSANLLNKDLDGLWTRQKEISNNISNLETPEYKSRRVSFESELKSLMDNEKGTSSELTREIKDVRPQIDVSDDKSLRLDGNNVDIEKENIDLARTQINYYYSLRELSDHFSRLRYAITEGK
jgi:flagellar basal-body rod protein FlgB